MVSLFGTVFSFIDEDGDKTQSQAVEGNENDVPNLAINEIEAIVERGSEVIDKNNKGEVENNIGSVSNKELKCDECNYSFRTKKYLYRHFERIHVKVRNYKCSICDLHFYANYELSAHYKKKCFAPGLKNNERQLDKEFKCKLCNYSTNIKLSLEHHHKRKHEKINHHKRKHEKICNFKCKNCYYSTDTKGSLVSHIKRRHDKILNYQCSVCERKTYGKREMKGHIINKHPNVDCSFKKFRSDQLVPSADSLKSKSTEVPLKSKSTEDPLKQRQISDDSTSSTRQYNKSMFMCAICNCSNQSLELLKMHIEKEHEGKEHYKCSTCGFASSSKDNVMIHLETNHSNQKVEILKLSRGKMQNKKK